MTKTAKKTVEKEFEYKIEMVPIDKIDHNPMNPRPIDRGHVEELKQMISENPNGVATHPIFGRFKGDRFEIIDGHHRMQAIKELGYPEAAVMATEMSDEAAAFEVITANRHKPLDILAIGRHFISISSMFKIKQIEYAAKIGKSLPYVTLARDCATVVESLAPDVKSRLAEYMTEHAVSTHIGHIASADPKLWEPLVNTLISQQLSVNQLDDVINQARVASERSGALLTPEDVISNRDTGNADVIQTENNIGQPSSGGTGVSGIMDTEYRGGEHAGQDVTEYKAPLDDNEVRYRYFMEVTEQLFEGVRMLIDMKLNADNRASLKTSLQRIVDIL